MGAARRFHLLLGIFFLGLWVGEQSARAGKYEYKIRKGVDVVVEKDDDGSPLRVFLNSPSTGGDWKFIAYANYVSDDMYISGNADTTFLPARLPDNTTGTFCVTASGYMAFLPVEYEPASPTNHFHWATRELGNEAYLVFSVASSRRQGLFVTRFSDNQTLKLDDYFHGIAAESWTYVHLLTDGTIYLPGSGAYFDTSSFDRPRTSALLKAATVADIERFRGLYDPASSSSPFGSGPVYEPGHDITAIFHPLWVRLGPGLATGPGGNFDNFLLNLRRLAWLIENSPDNRSAAESAFRLFVDEKNLRATLGEAGSVRPLTPEDYRRYIEIKKSSHDAILAGNFPSIAPGDWWVTKDPIWSEIMSQEKLPQRFEALARLVKQADPGKKRAAQAAARLLLGGEQGLRRYAGARGGTGLTERDYEAACLARARGAQIAVARLNLEKWLTDTYPAASGWWGGLAQVIVLRADPALSEAAIDIIESRLGGKRGVAESVGKDVALLTPGDYIAAARRVSAEKFAEELAGVCRRILDREGGALNEPGVN